MKREQITQRLAAEQKWDIAIIGGGATGLGAALEAVARGYKTVLFEQGDFCEGTSSKSTKLIHGGVRYLAQGNLTLVVDALRERGMLLGNAPGLVRKLPLIVPAYRRTQLAFYGTGLTLYDLLAGKLGIGHTRILSADAVKERIQTVRRDGLKGGILFFDGQFDDTRLGIALLRAFSRLGGLAVNYCPVNALLKHDGKVRGVAVTDRIGGGSYEIEAGAVINAAGVFADRFRLMADPNAGIRIAASQGSHLVFDRRFLPGDTALLVPKTDDGRVLFVIPWHGRVLAGTTDVPVAQPERSPVPSDVEVDFMLEHLHRYLDPAPNRGDILSMFAGLRPLVAASRSARTASLSRDHVVEVLGDRLISVMGGKWTTYRKMGEDAVNRAAAVAGLPTQPSPTRNLTLTDGDVTDARESPNTVPRSAPDSREIARFVTQEWACTVEDVLARRSRLLLLDARAAIDAAPGCARMMASELGRDSLWVETQVEAFKTFALGYLPSGSACSETQISP